MASTVQMIRHAPSGSMDSGEREKLMTLCQELADDFATRAAEYDREGKFPVENFAKIKEANLLAIMIPKEYGGWGADFLTYTKALETLAKGDPATALAYNMHNIMVGSIAEVPEAVGDDRHASAANEFRAWVYGECVKNRKVFASATSEPGIGAHVSALQTTYERVDDGFLVNGVKAWVSMAGYADYYVVAAKAKHSKSKQAAVSFLIVDRDSEGVTMKDTWDVLGMRSTSTNPVTLKDVLVPKSRLFLASEGLALYKVAREPHWLVGGYVGVYLGVMQAIFDFVVDYMKNKTKAGTDMKMAQDPVIQHQIGELYSKLQSARLATYHGAHLVDTARGTDEANAAIHHSKYLVSEGGPEMASMAIRMCGATALSRKLPIERLYRDSRCGSLMPAYTDDCLNYLGKAAIGTNLKNPVETYW